MYLRQGDVQRAIPVLERAVGLCQDWHIPLLLPEHAAALGLAYALEGRVAEASDAGGTGGGASGREEQTRELASAVTCLSEAYLLAGRLEDARQRAERLSSSPASTSNGPPGLGPVAPGRDARASRASRRSSRP